MKCPERLAETNSIGNQPTLFALEDHKARPFLDRDFDPTRHRTNGPRLPDLLLPLCRARFGFCTVRVNLANAFPLPATHKTRTNFRLARVPSLVSFSLQHFSGLRWSIRSITAHPRFICDPEPPVNRLPLLRGDYLHHGWLRRYNSRHGARQNSRDVYRFVWRHSRSHIRGHRSPGLEPAAIKR